MQNNQISPSRPLHSEQNPEGSNASVPDIVTMHGDSSSSDTTPLAGPGVNSPKISHHNNLGAFPTMLQRGDGNIFALATSFADFLPYYGPTETPAIHPEVWIIDGETGQKLSDPYKLDANGLLSGVYAYVEQDQSGNGADRLVTTISDEAGIHIAKFSASPETGYTVSWENYATITDFVMADDSIISLSPDADGDIWFVTAQGVLGVVSHNDEPTRSLQLGRGETINNSFSTATLKTGDQDVQIAAIASSQKLYLVKKPVDPTESLALLGDALSYEYGHQLKPGQLPYAAPLGDSSDRPQIWGTGATPTFFGPDTGVEYVMITGNNHKSLKLYVWEVRTGRKICEHQLFKDPNARGTENSAIGIGNTIIVSSSYGYPYPVPEDFFIRREHPFYGGMTRVDLSFHGDIPIGAETVWEQPVRSAAVPRLSLQDSRIYTMTRQGASNVASAKDHYAYCVMRFDTGEVEYKKDLRKVERFQRPESERPGYVRDIRFALDDPLQMVGCVSQNKVGRTVLWQGTMDGFFRIEAL